MKALLFIISILFFVSGNAQLSNIRKEYPAAATNENIAQQLYEKLKPISEKDATELLGYKGAVLTLMAKFTKSKKDKKEFFKSGVALLEQAISKKPENVELRYLRITVQTSAPKFLGYHSQIEEDKAFLLKEIESTTHSELKKTIAEFVKQSDEFSEVEKEKFQ